MLLVAVGLVGACCRSVVGATSLWGFGSLPMIADSPTDHSNRSTYECNLFVAPHAAASARGVTRRMGAPPHELPRYDGFYNVSVDAGTYTLLLSQPLFFIRPKVRAVSVAAGQDSVQANMSLCVDYSMQYRLDKQWTSPSPCWYQTFVATGTSISGVAYVLAGEGAKEAEVSVLKAPSAGAAHESNVTRWTKLGSRRVAEGTDTDNWVRWRSGEVPTQPGHTYAAEVCGAGGAGVQPFYRKKDTASYPFGSAVDLSGNAQPFDLAMTIFSDNDGTVVTLSKRTPGIGSLAAGSENWSPIGWGQSFIAATTGGLAAADVFVAGASNEWNLTMEWSVHRNSPTGEQVGGSKRSAAAYQADGFGLHGCAWARGEVPLQQGMEYVVVFTVVDPPSDSQGFNPSVSDDPGSGAWMATAAPGVWKHRPNVTLSATIIEWATEVQ